MRTEVADNWFAVVGRFAASSFCDIMKNVKILVLLRH